MYRQPRNGGAVIITHVVFLTLCISFLIAHIALLAAKLDGMVNLSFSLSNIPAMAFFGTTFLYLCVLFYNSGSERYFGFAAVVVVLLGSFVSQLVLSKKLDVVMTISYTDSMLYLIVALLAAVCLAAVDVAQQIMKRPAGPSARVMYDYRTTLWK